MLLLEVKDTGLVLLEVEDPRLVLSLYVDNALLVLGAGRSDLRGGETCEGLSNGGARGCGGGVKNISTELRMDPREQWTDGRPPSSTEVPSTALLAYLGGEAQLESGDIRLGSGD